MLYVRDTLTAGERKMFKPLQIVYFGRIAGIVTAVEGRFVTIMWEEGSRDVELRTASAIQWLKSIRPGS